MPVVQIPLPTSSTEDQPQRGGSGKLINAMLELLPDNRVIRKRAPGLTQFSTSSSGAIHCRGMILVNAATLLAVYNDMVEAVLSSGASTALGPVSGSGLVTLAKNNASPLPDVVCVAGGIAYVLTTSGAPAAYPDADVGSPNSVCFGDGYFFFTYGSGKVQSSGINSTSINPLDAAQVNSSSTTLLRGVYFSQTLFLFTQDKIEAWTNTANPTGFPFSRSAVIPRGLINANAVAGQENEFASTLIFVGADHIVYQLNGYSPIRISTNDIERRITEADETSLRACVYMSDGHAFWQLTSNLFTLCFDITGTYWFERKSDQMAFSRIECGCYAFGDWLAGDYATGKLGWVKSSVYSEYGEELTYSVQSLPFNGDFPKRRIVKRTDFNFVVGTGLPNATENEPLPVDYASNPQIKVSWSDDGGASFKFPLLRDLGKLGDTNHVVTVLRGGTSSRYGRVWRVEVSDPVYVGLFDATADLN
jgi:hypothetical protein